MRVVRDVAFFFHEQAEYDHVMDDLDYCFFQERYWDALVEVPDMEQEVQRGCLALLYAMAMFEAGNVGIALGECLPACHARLATYAPQDEVSGRLKELALEALSVAATDQAQRDWVRVEALLAQAELVHRLAVRPYFDSRSSGTRRRVVSST
ncbi:MAG TPA: hypothetical protein VER33_05025 [Polyangiaceae bacterium]|nr:hypothetical protein [Polyangiaceae bacterium]